MCDGPDTGYSPTDDRSDEECTDGASIEEHNAAIEFCGQCPCCGTNVILQVNGLPMVD